MKRATIVLLVLCLVTMFTVSAPAVAEEESDEESVDPGCVSIQPNGPGATVDPRCVMATITSIVS